MQPVFYDLSKNERVLWLSVIERAMHEATEPKPSVRQAAIQWLLRDQEDFPRVCEMAGLDCAYLRKKLRLYGVNAQPSFLHECLVPHQVPPASAGLAHPHPVNA